MENKEERKMKAIRITEDHVKEASEWAKEAAFSICENDSERPRVYSAIMEGVRIGLLTVASNLNETEELIKEWWE